MKGWLVPGLSTERLKDKAQGIHDISTNSVSPVVYGLYDPIYISHIRC